VVFGLLVPAPLLSTGAGQIATGGGFHVLDTEHFRITYDTSREVVTPLVGRLEATYEGVRRFCEASGLQLKPLASRLEVVVFDRYEDFSRRAQVAGVAGASIAGFYHPESNTTALCSVLDTPDLRRITWEIERIQRQIAELVPQESDSKARAETREGLEQTGSRLTADRNALAERFNRLVIQHEVAHQVLYNLGAHVRGGSNPPWLLEGLACQFEVLSHESGEWTAGINDMRLADLREALGVAPDAKSVSEDAYRKAFESGRLAPLVDLVSDPALLAKDDGNLAFRYAQCWALVHFLRHKDGKAFATYLRMRSGYQPGVQMQPESELAGFRAAFGEPNGSFQRQWLSYVLGLPFNPADAGR
jgi:hypothetical protein